MPPKLYKTVQEFWAAISHSVKSRNYPSFHPCCRVWVSRSQRVCRESHSKKIAWGSLLASVDFEGRDTQAGLAAHMEEHGWGKPIIMNKRCRASWSGISPVRESRNQVLQQAQHLQRLIKQQSMQVSPTGARVRSTFPGSRTDRSTLIRQSLGRLVPPMVGPESFSKVRRANLTRLKESVQQLQSVQGQLVQKLKNLTQRLDTTLEALPEILRDALNVAVPPQGGRICFQPTLNHAVQKVGLLQTRVESVEYKLDSFSNLSRSMSEVKVLRKAHSQEVARLTLDRDRETLRAEVAEPVNARLLQQQAQSRSRELYQPEYKVLQEELEERIARRLAALRRPTTPSQCAHNSEHRSGSQRT